MIKKKFRILNLNKANYKNAIFIYSLQITLVLSNFIIVYFISNNYSPEIYAVYTTNKSLAVIFAIIGSMGISFVSIKLLTMSKINDTVIISSSIKIQFKYVCLSLIILIFFVLYLEFDYFFAISFFLTYVMIEFRNILYSSYHAKSNFSFSSAVGIVSVTVYTGGSAILAFNSYPIFYIVIFQLIVVFISNIFVLKKLDFILKKSSIDESQYLIENESKKMVLTSASLIIISEIEIVFLSFFTQGKLLGILALTRRLLEIGSQTFSSLLDIAYPKLTKNIQNLKTINRYVYFTSLLLFLIPIILFLDISFVQKIFEYFVGEEYVEVLRFLPVAFLSLPFMFRVRANIIIARSLYIEQKISFYILISSFLIFIFYFVNYRLEVVRYDFVFLFSQIMYWFFTELSIYKEKKSNYLN